MITKKLLQLSALFGITCLALSFVWVALPAVPISAGTTSGSAAQAKLTPGEDLGPHEQGPLNLRPITGLTLTLSAPATVNKPATFIASASGASPILFSWDFGDGNSSPLSDSPTRRNTYGLTGTYTIIVTAVNGFDNLDFATASIIITVGENFLYLPLAFKEFNPPPPPQADLVCSSLTIDPANPNAGQAVRVTLQIANQGQVEADGFWVDLYVDPDQIPQVGRDNRIRWRDACGAINTCPRGIAWAVSLSPLAPNQARTFTSIPITFNPTGGQGFDPASSLWYDGFFSAGEHKLYAYVDSINGLVNSSIDGAVDETRETNNLCQLVLNVSPAPASIESDQPNSLPQR